MADEFDPDIEDITRVRKYLHGREDPALTTREIAKQFDFSLDYARKLLFYMESDGILGVKELEEELIWWPLAVPKLDETARGLLLDPDYQFPLSIEEVHEIASEFVDSDGRGSNLSRDIETNTLSSGALRIAFQHLEKAEERIKKAGDRLNKELDVADDGDAEDSEFKLAYRMIKSSRQIIGEELINRDERLRR